MPQNLIKIEKYQGVYYLESKKKIYKKQPDRCFYITYRTPSKKFVREKIGWASEGYNTKMVFQVRAERLRTIRHGKELPNKKKIEPTLSEIWKHYDKWLDTGKKHVYDDRNRYKNHIKTKYASKSLSQITTHDLEKFKDHLLKKGLSPATTKHVLVLIRQIYNKAITWNLWQGISPTKGLIMPKINNKRSRFLTHQEAHVLLEAIKKKSQQIYEISLTSLHTGMRANEIFSMHWGHINFDLEIIHVADPKGGQAREVYMTKTLIEILKNKKKGSPAELVFKSLNNKKIIQPSKIFLLTVRQLGLNTGIEDRRQIVSFHTLRHTYASWLAIQGTPILEIKELLGHKTLAMTERYAHLIPDQKRASIKKMETTFLDKINHQENNDDPQS